MMSMTVAKCKSSGSNETLSLYCGPLSLVFSDEGNVCILSRQHRLVALYIFIFSTAVMSTRGIQQLSVSYRF